MKFCYGLMLLVLLVPTSANARWDVMTSDKKFKDIYARNGKLLGIEAKTNIPFLWVKPEWKQLGNENLEFFLLVTDGVTIAGIKLDDKCAYIFNGLSWQRLTPFLFLKFDWLGFSQNKLVGLAEQPLARVYVWDSPAWEDAGSFWKVLGDPMGSPMFWRVDAAEKMICGVRRLLEASGDPDFMPKTSEIAKKQTNCAYIYQPQKNDWKKISTRQFQQVVTNGTNIYGIGFDQYVYDLTGKNCKKLGEEKIFELAINGPILCGRRWEEAIKFGRKSLLGVQWTGQKWSHLGTKKLKKVVTDGENIYGLDKVERACHWSAKES